jgi:hypothetical protein
MLTYLTQYKAHVAPVYQSEIDRHLFATASFRGRDKSRGAVREWLRAQLSRLVHSRPTSAEDGS